MQMTTLLNRTDGRPDELTLIRSEPISMQWTNELRRIPNQRLECESDRRSLEGFPYHNPKAIGNRSRATEEKGDSAPLESKRSVKDWRP
jgi:hypothetical protein